MSGSVADEALRQIASWRKPDRNAWFSVELASPSKSSGAISARSIARKTTAFISDTDAFDATGEIPTPDSHTLFQQTAQWTEPYTIILGRDLPVIKRIMTQDDYGEAAWPPHDSLRWHHCPWRRLHRC